jgi:hypothetical protein
MPRGKRLQLPRAIYHIISRGIERRKIYLDNADREEFLRSRIGDGVTPSKALKEYRAGGKCCQGVGRMHVVQLRRSLLNNKGRAYGPALVGS